MRWMLGLTVCVMMMGGLSLPVAAEAQASVRQASLLSDRTPQVGRDMPAQRAGSLFAGRRGNSLFARTVVPVAVTPDRAVAIVPSRKGPLADLRALIAKAEAGAKGYDAVQYGARIKPAGPPTTLTVQQIYDWIDDTPGQPHAIGRYQFIPPTLRRLVKRAGIDPRVRFTPRVQDQLADILLAEAGLRKFLAGDMARHAFMNNLAKIWAGLPNDTGKSHYHGYAGNKATMTWVYFDTQMARIFPG